MNRTNYLHPKPFSKPLSSSGDKYYIGLNKEWVDRAYRGNKKIMITVRGVGKGLYTADEWMEGSQEISKVYKRPNEPMQIVMNYFERGHGLKSYEVMDLTVPDTVRIKLFDKLKEKYGKSGNPFR